MKKFVFIVVAFFALQCAYSQADLNSITPIPFEIIENQPVFPGGNNEFMKFIGKNFKAPENENFTGGVLKITFVIETDGSIGELKVLKDLGYGTAMEIRRVMSICPKWTPGEQGGKPARVIFTLPVTIRI